MAKATMRAQGDTKYEPLPADTYYMQVRDADITKSAFKDQKTGEDQLQLQLTWEITRLTDEQAEADVDEDRWVKQWLSLYYGETKNGPSKMKAFIDGLQAQGLLEEFDPATAEIDSDWFIGIEQRVTLAVKGDFNNVVMVAPLKIKKASAKVEQAAAVAAPKKNAPRRIEQAPVTVADDDDDLFAEDE
jgi:hypothetical protein